MRGRPVSLFLLVLLSPQTAASGESLQAAQVSWTGQGDLLANLAGAVMINATGLEGLSLQIQQGSMDIDSTRHDVYTTGAGATPAETNRTTRPLIGAHAVDFLPQKVNRILIIPLDAKATASIANGTLRPASIDSKTYETKVFQERVLTIDASRALEMDNGESIAVSGRFLVAVWGINFTMDSQGQREAIRTGEAHESVQGSIVPTQVASTHIMREAFITVTQGNLTLPLQGAQTYLNAPRLDLAQGLLELRNPRGILPVDHSAIPSESQTLTFSAPILALLDRTAENQVQVQLPEAPEEAALDGMRVRGSTSNPWILALALFALVAVPTAATAFSRIQLRRRLRALDTLMRTRCFDRALALARTIRRSRPRQQEALVAETLSLLQAQQYKEATEVLDSKGWSPGLMPMRDYLRATAAAGQGKRSEAIQWLKRCLHEAPDMAPEVAMNPLVADLLPLAKKGGANALPGTA